MRTTFETRSSRYNSKAELAKPISREELGRLRSATREHNLPSTFFAIFSRILMPRPTFEAKARLKWNI